MYYNLAQLFKEPTGSTRNYKIDDSFVGPENGMDRVQGWVRVIRTHQGFLVQAELETQLNLACSRCLSQFELDARLKIEEEALPTVDPVTGKTTEPSGDVEGDIYLDDQHVLDMKDVIRQYVLTEVPIKPLCCEECSGLCPECGSDQNKEKCKCNTSPVDPRWRSLAELLTERRE